MSVSAAGRAAARAALVVLALVLAACARLPEPDARVELFEMGFGVSETLPASEVVLEVVNVGYVHHNLTLCPGTRGACTGDAVTMDVLRKPDARDPDAVPERTSSFTIGSEWDALARTEALEPGSYRIYCAIIGHVQRGMDTVVQVR